MSILLEVLGVLCCVSLIGAILVLDVYFWTEYIDSDLSVLWVFLTLPFILIIDVITIILLIKNAIIEKKHGYF
jgi:hypothetical protein